MATVADLKSSRTQESLKRAGVSSGNQNFRSKKSTEAPIPSVPDVPQPPVVSSPKSSGTRRKSLGRSRITKPKSILTELDLDANDQDIHQGWENLLKLYGLVVKYYENHPVAGTGLVLWGDLQVLMDSQEGGTGSFVCNNQSNWQIRSWRLYTLSNVHVLETISKEVLYMFVDVSYPLSMKLMERMLKHKLEIDRIVFVGMTMVMSVIPQRFWGALGRARVFPTGRVHKLVLADSWGSVEKDYRFLSVMALETLALGMILKRNPPVTTTDMSKTGWLIQMKFEDRRQPSCMIRSSSEAEESSAKTVRKTSEYEEMYQVMSSCLDKVPTRKYRQDIMEEISLTIDEAKLKKMADEMLRQRIIKQVEETSNVNKADKWISKGNRLSPNKSSTGNEKINTSRSCLSWKPMSRTFKTAGLRWIPTRNIFTSRTTKVGSEPPNGSKEDITNPYKCEQTLNVSACTLNLDTCTSYNVQMNNLRVWFLKRLMSKNQVPQEIHKQEQSLIISQGVEEQPQLAHFDDPCHELLHEVSILKGSSSNVQSS
ncbi:hypothetical protein Tco_0155969 [Tanacetum coccineum]